MTTKAGKIVDELTQSAKQGASEKLLTKLKKNDGRKNDRDDDDKKKDKK